MKGSKDSKKDACGAEVVEDRERAITVEVEEGVQRLVIEAGAALISKGCRRGRPAVCLEYIEVD